MSKEIFIYIKCATCGDVNAVAISRNESDLLEDEKDLPFDIYNEKMWKLLDEAMHDDIEAVKKEICDDMTITRATEREIFVDETQASEKEIDYLESKGLLLNALIAERLKFSDEGTFNFKICDHCNEPFMFYIVSV